MVLPLDPGQKEEKPIMMKYDGFFLFLAWIQWKHHYSLRTCRNLGAVYHE
jgi:hypothetical protein